MHDPPLDAEERAYSSDNHSVTHHDVLVSRFYGQKACSNKWPKPSPKGKLTTLSVLWQPAHHARTPCLIRLFWLKTGYSGSLWRFSVDFEWFSRNHPFSHKITHPIFYSGTPQERIKEIIQSDFTHRCKTIGNRCGWNLEKFRDWVTDFTM